MDGTQVDTFGLPINQSVCFTNHKNNLHLGARKRQLKTLRELAPMLKQILQSDEEVLLAVRAASPMSWFEQITTGWVIYLLKRCVLVFTNKRVLHFPTRMNFKPKASVAEICYGDVMEAKASGFLGRALKLKYRSGKKEDFNYIESPSFQKLKALLPTLPKGGAPAEAGERRHLCPRCRARLTPKTYSCASCRLQFKDGARAIRLSILYPGGGYFYTGHFWLGIGDAIAEALLLIGVIAAGIDALSGEKPEAWVSVLFFGVALLIEKAETIYHAKHYISEYIPEDEKFLPLTLPN
jgi:hypothetical protein